MRTRLTIGLVLAATALQFFMLTADAAQPGTLAGSIHDVQTHRPVAGITVLAFVGPSPAATQGVDQQGQPIATAITEQSGRFVLRFPQPVSLSNVGLRIVPTRTIPCDLLVLRALVAIAPPHVARFSPNPPGDGGAPTPTFELFGAIRSTSDPCSYEMSSAAGLHKDGELE